MQKPSHSKTQIYSQVYDPKKIHLNQTLFLKRYNNIWGYNYDFNKGFKFNFCNNCHSCYQHSKDTNFSSPNANYISIEDSDSSTNSSSPNNDSDYILPNNKNSDLHLKLEAKVIINIKNSISIPTKWFTIDPYEFDIFYCDLINHICKHLNNNNIDKDNFEITYKVNGHEQELSDEDSDSNKKILKTKSKKKSKSNYIPKESNLITNKTILAKIASQLQLKY
ncbi:17511_t:CDS:2 [Cetraspora pellucida]|uniref:17511_t:CDS:1 n=1 Tax=Cetraspora pellucida TaxID=1433469 RepID=A0A9N9DVM7_9GLOM|nr:17511_t:CDS:2 [Cetraspora pellucida]